MHKFANHITPALVSSSCVTTNWAAGMVSWKGRQGRPIKRALMDGVLRSLQCVHAVCWIDQGLARCWCAHLWRQGKRTKAREQSRHIHLAPCVALLAAQSAVLCPQVLYCRPIFGRTIYRCHGMPRNLFLSHPQLQLLAAAGVSIREECSAISLSRFMEFQFCSTPS